MNYIPLPPEFASLEGRVQWVQQINSNEYHMSCPNCGIDAGKHNDSHPSDRFVVWMESKSNGKPFGMCLRHCGYKWSTDKQDAEWTPEEKAVFVAKRRELEQRENERIIEYAHKVVMKQAIYLNYQKQLEQSNYGKQYLYGRGFNSDEWNDFFGYGIIEDYKVRGRSSTYYSPAITMPVRGLDNVIENIKLRVTTAHEPADRFRNIYKSGNQHAYFPMHDEVLGNKILVIEGEMKSNQVAMRGNLPDDIQIVATQGMGVGSRMIYMLEKAEVVYLCLDPDAYAPNEKGNINAVQVARKIGYERTRFVICRDKIDDAIRQGFVLRNAVNMAIKPNQLRG